MSRGGHSVNIDRMSISHWGMRGGVTNKALADDKWRTGKLPPPVMRHGDREFVILFPCLVFSFVCLCFVSFCTGHVNSRKYTFNDFGWYWNLIKSRAINLHQEERLASVTNRKSALIHPVVGVGFLMLFSSSCIVNQPQMQISLITLLAPSSTITARHPLFIHFLLS